MIHYTMNTGHSRSSPRSEVGEQVIETLRPWFRASYGEFEPIPGYKVQVFVPLAGGALATVSSVGDVRPCVSWAVALNDEAADKVWPHVEKLYHSITNRSGIRSADFAAAQKPSKAPWIAAMTILATPEEAFWIADLERCFAWAFAAETGFF